MDNTNIVNDLSLAQARKLVAELEAGNGDAAASLVEDLAKSRESGLFHELGKMTRDLHEALNSFQLDSRMADLASVDIPDAKERLNYVITMTEDAANKTLGAVEETLPVAENMQRQARELHDKWTRFRSKEMSVEEFRELSKEVDTFLAFTVDSASKVNSNLSDVMMAQGFQDLTGQVIRKVITLVKEVEDNLVTLVRISGQRFKQPDESKTAKQCDSRGHGPQVPGVDKGTDVVSGQDDVDDLLSSLGF